MIVKFDFNDSKVGHDYFCLRAKGAARPSNTNMDEDYFLLLNFFDSKLLDINFAPLLSWSQVICKNFITDSQTCELQYSDVNKQQFCQEIT